MPNRQFTFHPPAKNPMEQLMAVVCILHGSTQLLFQETPQSIDNNMPAVVAIIWALFLLVGGLLVLFATIKRNNIVAAWMAFIGYALLAPSCLVYAAACFITYGSGAIEFFALFPLGFGIAATRLLASLWNDLYRIPRLMERARKLGL